METEDLDFFSKKRFKMLLTFELRTKLFNEIIAETKNIAAEITDLNLKYKEIQINEKDFIPVLFSEKKKPDGPLLTIFSAQHNEFNGLFGVLKFLKSDKIELLKRWMNKTKGGFVFFPILNPIGFLNPNKENKWGYYATVDGKKIKINTNRFWDKTLGYNIYNKNARFIPIINRKIGAFLLELRNIEQYPKSQLIILDFHETSLVYRYRREMEVKLTPKYQIDHWIKQWIIDSMLNYLNLPLNTPLTNNICKKIRGALFRLNERMDRKSFYFICHSSSNENLAHFIDDKVENTFNNKLINTNTRSFLRPYVKQGCFVCASESRPEISGMAFEMRKTLYDFKEVSLNVYKSKTYRERIFKIMQLNRDISYEIICHSLEYFLQN